MANPNPPIEQGSEIVPDEHWLPRREVFEVLYSYPRAVPFLHEGCAKRKQPAQYLQRTDAGIRCPSCERVVTPHLVRALGIESS